MNLRRFFLISASIASLSAALGSLNPVMAQEAESTAEAEVEVMSEEGIERVSIFDSAEQTTATPSQSDVSRSKMSISELRQARALRRANERRARLEYNLWIGHEPLRPRWNAIPMMSSRYGRPTIYVPIFVYSN